MTTNPQQPIGRGKPSVRALPQVGAATSSTPKVVNTNAVPQHSTSPPPHKPLPNTSATPPSNATTKSPSTTEPHSTPPTKPQPQLPNKTTTPNQNQNTTTVKFKPSTTPAATSGGGGNKPGDSSEQQNVSPFPVKLKSTTQQQNTPSENKEQQQPQKTEVTAHNTHPLNSQQQQQQQQQHSVKPKSTNAETKPTGDNSNIATNDALKCNPASVIHPTISQLTAVKPKPTTANVETKPQADSITPSSNTSKEDISIHPPPISQQHSSGKLKPQNSPVVHPINTENHSLISPPIDIPPPPLPDSSQQQQQQQHAPNSALKTTKPPQHSSPNIPPIDIPPPPNDILPPPSMESADIMITPPTANHHPPPKSSIPPPPFNSNDQQQQHILSPTGKKGSSLQIHPPPSPKATPKNQQNQNQQSQIDVPPPPFDFKEDKNGAKVEIEILPPPNIHHPPPSTVPPPITPPKEIPIPIPPPSPKKKNNPIEADALLEHLIQIADNYEYDLSHEKAAEVTDGSVLPLPIPSIDTRMNDAKFVVNSLLERAENALKIFNLAQSDVLKKEKEAILNEIQTCIETIFVPEFQIINRIESIKQRFAYRQHVVDELWQTERDYLADLRTIDSVWLAEIKNTTLMSKEEQNVVFANIGQLLLLTETIEKALQEAHLKPAREQKIGEAFKSKIPFLRLYIEYCINEEKSHSIVANAMKSSRFRDFMEKIQTNNPQTRNLDLPAFLIKPTQRVMKYPLFLKDLIEHTDSDHPDYHNLVLALEEMKKVLAEINKRTKERATITIINEIQPRISWKGETGIDFLLSNCRIVMNGKFKTVVTIKADPTISPIKGNRVYMFNSVLFVCKSSSTSNSLKELATFTIADTTFKSETDRIIITNSKSPEEVILIPDNHVELKIWIQSLTETIADKNSAEPIKTFTVPKKENKLKERAGRGSVDMSKINKEPQEGQAQSMDSPSPQLSDANSPTPISEGNKGGRQGFSAHAKKFSTLAGNVMSSFTERSVRQLRKIGQKSKTNEEITVTSSPNPLISSSTEKHEDVIDLKRTTSQRSIGLGSISDATPSVEDSQVGEQSEDVSDVESGNEEENVHNNTNNGDENEKQQQIPNAITLNVKEPPPSSS